MVTLISWALPLGVVIYCGALAITDRIAMHPQRYAYRCDRHPAPVYGIDRDTVEATARDWCEHDVREHQR